MKNFLNLLFFCIFFTFSIFAKNPFYLGLTYDQELSYVDYLEVQERLRTIDIKEYLKVHYDRLKGNFTTFEDFYERCTKGLKQILIDPSQNYYPKKVFKKIGFDKEGWDNCIVCSVPYNGKYPHYLQTIELELEKVGYNGYFLYYLGGWPNPTGKEIEFCAVPYSFKIFAMHEAYLLGCKNVLWIDSACFPVRNPMPLFKNIERTGALLNHFLVPLSHRRLIFPSTRDELLSLTGTDVLDPSNHYINTIVFGLKMDTPQAQKLVREYYKMAEKGTPFLSCFPEEWVISAIMGQSEFTEMKKTRIQKLVLGSVTKANNCPEEYQKVRRAGYYFFHRRGR